MIIFNLKNSIDVFEIAKTNEELDIESDLEYKEPRLALFNYFNQRR